MLYILSIEYAMNQQWFSTDVASKAVNTLISKLQNIEHLTHIQGH